MKWYLDNGVDRHGENPETFELPNEGERKSLVPSMFAKLIFLTEDGGERMWVEVTDVVDDGYVGKLANTPFTIDGLEFGDLVAFGSEHIIDIHVPEFE